jgi:hypothetical protein
MIVDRQLATNLHESVQQLEENIRYFASQFKDQPSTLRNFFKESILKKFADIHFFLGKLNSRAQNEEKDDRFRFSIAEPEQTCFNTSENSLKPEIDTQTPSSCWSVKDSLADVLSSCGGSRSAEFGSRLEKRRPELLLIAHPDQKTESDEYKFELDRQKDLNFETAPTTPRRRGRVISCFELETFLVESIKAEWFGSREQSSRRWIATLARNFIKQNNLDLKCSKGWLDKFIRRNQHLL